jgi:hypothetical protein
LQAVTVVVAVTGVPVDVTIAMFGRSTQPVWVAGTGKVACVLNVVARRLTVGHRRSRRIAVLTRASTLAA